MDAAVQSSISPHNLSSPCWRIPQSGGPDVHPNDHTDDKSNGRKKDISRNDGYCQISAGLPAQRIEDPHQEEREKDWTENRQSGGGETCHEPVEDDSSYFCGAVRWCRHSKVIFEPDAIQVKVLA